MGSGMAGSLESNDILVTISPNAADGIDIELTSPVERQFGSRIREVIHEALVELGVTNARVLAYDRGALDFTIRARVITAVQRASE